MSKHTYVAFDPGDRWAGVAIATLREDEWLVETAVLDCALDPLRPAKLLENFIRSPEIQGRGMMGHRLSIVAEDFRMRPQKHLSWNSGRTLRLLGALEYVTTQVFSGVAWYLVPAGDADRELPLLAIGESIARWAKKGWTPAAPRWQHARSAWRALARHFLTTQPMQLRRFAKEQPRLLKNDERLFYVDEGPRNEQGDLIASAARWSWA